MTDEEDDGIDELREQTRGADRISAEVSDGDGKEDSEETEEVAEEKTVAEEGAEDEKKDAGPSPSDAFAAAFDERAERTNAGVDPSSVSAKDPGLSAFLLALQDTGEIYDVGEAIRDGIGTERPPEYDRDAVVRLALTYAIRETAPDYFDELVERA
jgi:hypothetical protein